MAKERENNEGGKPESRGDRKFEGSTEEVRVTIIKDHKGLKKDSTHIVSKCTAEILTERGIADKNWKEVVKKSDNK